MKPSRTKKKQLQDKLLESYFLEDETAEFPERLLNKKTAQLLSSSIDIEEDETGFDIADGYFENPNALLNINVQAGRNIYNHL